MRMVARADKNNDGVITQDEIGRRGWRRGTRWKTWAARSGLGCVVGGGTLPSAACAQHLRYLRQNGYRDFRG